MGLLKKLLGREKSIESKFVCSSANLPCQGQHKRRSTKCSMIFNAQICRSRCGMRSPSMRDYACSGHSTRPERGVP